MHQEQRHQRILEVIAERGFVTIDELAQLFDMTPQTIRRDINTLEQDNLVRRYHGGAGLPSSTINSPYADRQIQNHEAKQRIADAIAARIPDRASMFINIGTTTETIARALLKHEGLTVITNNLHVASILSARDDFSVSITGGQVRNRDGGVIGESAAEFVRQFKVDFAIIGISGIDDDGELLDFDFEEVRVSKAIIENSRQVFLAADHSKFGRHSMVRLGHISLATHLFTDQAPPSKVKEALKDAGTELIIARKSEQ